MSTLLFIRNIFQIAILKKKIPDISLTGRKSVVSRCSTEVLDFTALIFLLVCGEAGLFSFSLFSDDSIFGDMTSF